MMSNPKPYVDVADQWRRDQLPANENERRWQAYQAEQQAEERAASAARELLAEKVRQHRYLRVEPTPQEIAAIEERHKVLATPPDWPAYRKAAAERAARAARKEYDAVADRLKQQAQQQPD